MKITIHGAGGGEVTGSAYMVQSRDAYVLVDFGLFQGARKVENYNRIPKEGAFERLNAVVLTHATQATIDFSDLIVKDSEVGCGAAESSATADGATIARYTLRTARRRPFATSLQSD
jgi:hypothetical protein